jgi:hypothetical protein
VKLLLLVLVLVFPPAAGASAVLADRNVTNLSLAVNDKGEALLRYAREDGRPRQVLVWGAVNARAPDRDVPQVVFQYDYAGGWKKYKRVVATTFQNRCTPYDGPPLVFSVAACKAPDGTYWAVQAWYRLLPMRGFDAWTPQQGALEYHVSHWSGPLAQLQVSQNWTYDGAWQGLFGRMTYGGAPVYGFSTPSATSRGDGYARYVYIDTHNSVYGPGWRHDAGKVLHLGSGAFCYSFVPQVPPAGYPDSQLRGPGVGDEHRVTVMGPGVTPDVAWEGPALGPFDPARDAVFNNLFDQFVGGADRACTNER